ncbi:MAG TPA: FkbM family methyltransferase [Verrucomicrobiae bacterium]|nr:FkbM family methyltransferase [Verrucomicrobiae bacterium]
MRKLIAYLSRFAVLRRTVQVLRLHKLANLMLRYCPLVKRLPGSNIVYRASSLESIPLAVEMFEKGLTYDRAFLQSLGPIDTFADLGCNVGYFTCLLADLNPGRQMKGLMIDANPQVVKEAAWHAQANQLREVYALHGIVGEPSPAGEGQFYLYESSICSAAQPPDADHANLKGVWTEVKVTCISLEKAWREKFGDSRCNLLKVDIEGSEMQFLQSEGKFLQLVDSIVLEWHKWRVQLPDIQALLKGHGFKLVKVFEEDASMGTCCFRRV